MAKSKGPIIGIGAVGLLAGGFVGFIMRPSAFLVGQLPFKHVITRGESLQGVERVLMSLAQESFNMMLAGAAIGLAVGIVVGYVVGRRR